MSETIDQKIMRWNKLKEQLVAVKEQESELRDEIVEEVFGQPDVAGTKNHELGMGYKLKAVFKMNRTIKGGRDEVEQALSAYTPDVAERLVTFTPKLSAKEYDRLSNEDRRAIDALIVTKMGKPSLDLVNPKN